MDSERLVVQLSAEQGGIVTRRQARDLGLTDAQLQYRVRKGRWTRLTGGYYQVLDLEGERDRLRAATAILPDAVVSHASAGRLLDLGRMPDTKPTVLVHSQSTNRFPDTAVVRTHDLEAEHTTVIDSLPTTTVARTVVDLAAILNRWALRRTVDEVVSRMLASPEEIRAVLESVARKGKPGIKRLRSVLGEGTVEGIAPSVLESRAHALLRSHGLSRFESEYSIPWAPLQRFDVAFPEAQLAVELDSRRWHTRVHDFDRDRMRDRAAHLHGWHVLRFTWNDVVATPNKFVSEIQRAIDLFTST